MFVFDHSTADVGGGGGGGSLEDFMKRGAFISNGNETRSVLTGIVPDGVARIEVEYPRRVSRGRYYKPVVYRSSFARSVSVRDNAVAFNVPRPPEDAFPPRMVWRTADGHVLRVVTSPRD